MARSPLLSAVRTAPNPDPQRKKPAPRAKPAVETLEDRIAFNVGDGFVYRLENLRPANALPSLTLSTRTLDATITHGRVGIDLANPGSGARGFFGNVSISPFRTNDRVPYIVNFSNYVNSFIIRGGDYGADTDNLTMQAFSGPNATGTQLTNVRVVLTPTTPNSRDFSHREFGVRAGFIKSVRFIGGSTSFPNSVFYDNISLTYNRPNYRGVSAAWDPARGGLTVTYRLENNWIDDKQFPSARVYWSRGRDQFGRHQLISQIGAPIPLGRSPSFGAPYTFNVPGFRLRFPPTGAREIVTVLDATNNAPEASETDNTLVVNDVQVFKGGASGTLSVLSSAVIKSNLRIAGEPAVVLKRITTTATLQIIDIDVTSMDPRARSRFVLAARADARVRDAFPATQFKPYIRIEIFQ